MSYKRLTQKSDNGYGIDGNLINQKQGAFDVCVDSFEIVLNRLAKLEDKIENGTLVELPCKVGDTVYFVNHYRTTPRIEEYKVYSFSFGKYGLFICIGFDFVISVNDVCLTKAEAEKKLEELSKNS